MKKVPCHATAIIVSLQVGAVVRVDGPSMQPTFNPDLASSRDWIFVEKLSYKWWHQYRRGEVAVLWCVAAQGRAHHHEQHCGWPFLTTLS